MPAYGGAAYPSYYITAGPEPDPDPFLLLDAVFDSGNVIFDDLVMTFDGYRTDPCSVVYLHGSFSSAIFMHGSC